jgi:hypothetical protein
MPLNFIDTSLFKKMGFKGQKNIQKEHFVANDPK